jgi:hypothetical protein
LVSKHPLLFVKYVHQRPGLAEIQLLARPLLLDRFHRLKPAQETIPGNGAPLLLPWHCIDYLTNAHAAGEIGLLQDKLDLLIDILIEDKDVRTGVLNLIQRSKIN